ncbi:hypothetical protein BGLA2_990106 [Burkholderia gladioli]|nr:hypothetical protein BGLA2_990106 [Burkholderia gladioli]
MFPCAANAQSNSLRLQYDGGRYQWPVCCFDRWQWIIKKAFRYSEGGCDGPSGRPRHCRARGVGIPMRERASSGLPSTRTG